ncbi:MAG: hypothetical protein AAF242_15640, partial [Bacteroidota bacterium]
VFEVKGDVEVSAGAIDGISKGSIFKLQPQAGDGDQTLGWVVVDQVNARDCLCSLIDFDAKKKTWQKRLPTPKKLARGRCEPPFPTDRPPHDGCRKERVEQREAKTQARVLRKSQKE